MSHNKPLLPGIRVLVVDDEQSAREILEVILAHYGAEVTAVGSAAVALTVIGQWRPDVLVSDISMPGEDGYTLIRKVRALDAAQGGRIPALAFTALPGSENRERALAAGFQSYLSKPADPFDLVRIVAKLWEIGTVGPTV